MDNRKHNSIRDMAYIAMCAALISVCALITVPLPAVSFTMQTFGVFATLNILGGKRGTIAIAVYIAIGVLGLPVFAGFNSGMSALLGPTGGYLWGFILQGLVFMLVTKFFKDGTATLYIANIAGQIVCYTSGTIWFVYVYAQNGNPIGFGAALMACVVPFIIPDLMKLALSVGISKRVKSALTNMGITLVM